jgi:hypothetical protein
MLQLAREIQITSIAPVTSITIASGNGNFEPDDLIDA